MEFYCSPMYRGFLYDKQMYETTDSISLYVQNFVVLFLQNCPKVMCLSLSLSGLNVHSHFCCRSKCCLKTPSEVRDVTSVNIYVANDGFWGNLIWLDCLDFIMYC